MENQNHFGRGDNIGRDKIEYNFYKSLEYKELQEKIEDLRELYSASGGEKKIRYYKRLAEAQNTMEAFKEGVIALAATFQKIEIDTTRLQKAKAHFEAGEFKEARAILDAELLEQDQEQLLQKQANLANETKENEEALKNNADEYLIKAQLTAIDFSLSNRFEQTVAYYEASLKSNRNKDNLFSYAYFLQEHKQNNRATPLYQEALEVYRKLAEANPQTYLPDVATSLNNLGNLQSAKNEQEAAEKSYQIGRASCRERLVWCRSRWSPYH